MEKKIVYPLDEVLSIKIKRVDQAKKVVQEKQKALDKQKEILKQREQDRDKVKEHRNAKLEQMYQAFDEGTNSDEIIMMRRYLDVVKEKLAIEEEKVKKQQENVNLAQKELDLAIKALKEKEKEVEKLETHKKEWVKEAKLELEKEIAKEQDDIGETMYLSRKMKK